MNAHTCIYSQPNKADKEICALYRALGLTMYKAD